VNTPTTQSLEQTYLEAFKARHSGPEAYRLMLNAGTEYGLALCRDLHSRGLLAYTRANRKNPNTSVLIYRRDTNSPTGVSLAGESPNTPEFITGLRALHGGYTPMSPTEGHR
jgi:hypothetical protein